MNHALNVEPSVPVKTLLDEPGAVLHTLPGAILLVWRQTPERDISLRVSEALLQAFQRHHARTHLLTISAPAVNLPDAETREIFSRILKQNEPFYASATNVLLSEGFIAAALRAMVRGMQALVKPPYPVKVFGDLDEGLRYFEHQAEGLDVSPLLALARAERGLGPPGP